MKKKLTVKPSDNLATSAKVLFDSYLNGRDSMETLVRTIDHNDALVGGLMLLTIASYMTDDQEVQLRKELAKRINAK